MILQDIAVRNDCEIHILCTRLTVLEIELSTRKKCMGIRGIFSESMTKTELKIEIKSKIYRTILEIPRNLPIKFEKTALKMKSYYKNMVQKC